jgi:hypothetical protein
VFAGMPCCGCIMAGFNNLSTKLLVIGNVQFPFVVEESVEFLPLKKVVNQSARAFLVEYFKDLGNFDFAIGTISNLLFEF